MLRSNDIGSGLYGGSDTQPAFLARWTLVDGQPRCPHAPLGLGSTGPAAGPCEADIAATLATNRAVTRLLSQAEAVEAAQRLLSDPQPPQWLPVFDGDATQTSPQSGTQTSPQTSFVENPAWAPWLAATNLVADASTKPALLHLLRTRNGNLAADEDGFTPTWPAMPVFDARTETVDWDGTAWQVRPLTAAEFATHPLRPAPRLPKPTFARLLSQTVGDSLATQILTRYAVILALSDSIDWHDVFTHLDQDPTQPAYATQLLTEGLITQPQITLLKSCWPHP